MHMVFCSCLELFDRLGVFHAKLFDKCIVELRLDLFLHCMACDLEYDRRACKRRLKIIFREGNIDFFLFLFFDADQLFFKSRNKGMRS